MTANDEYILEILESMGLITFEQGREALRLSQEQDKDISDVLEEAEWVTKPEVLKAIASQFGMEVVSLKNVDIPKEVIGSVPPEVARRFRVVPIYRTEGSLTVALSNPFDVDTLDGLRYVLKCNVDGAVAPADEIEDALNHYYAFTADSVDNALQDIREGGADVTVADSGDQLAEGVDMTEADAPIIKLVSLIILEAFRNRASDIHLEPLSKEFRVRYRIDGVLHEVESPPRKLQSAIISRLKIMANMKMSEKRVPQDGRIMVPVMDRQLDLRVSSVPTNHGESIVMRILDKQGLMLGLPQLGFLADDQATFERLVDLADGIILVTGPTGSGKTTTLYACLNQINKPDRKIITVEDPVEYQISGINQ
ncbi:MAG: ATPase, T2SS/T4P/T4SS family, partial [Kiritimatiellae bacterium]|nr:ATPase, T2SS/T4P/T4SS family [Kiritimatiellia bacterium]